MKPDSLGKALADAMRDPGGQFYTSTNATTMDVGDVMEAIDRVTRKLNEIPKPWFDEIRLNPGDYADFCAAVPRAESNRAYATAGIRISPEADCPPGVIRKYMKGERVFAWLHDPEYRGGR